MASEELVAGLLRDALAARESPEARAALEARLMKSTPEELQNVYHGINPYARTAPAAQRGQQGLVFSITRPEETFTKRLLVTAITGFLFKVLSEWEPPAELRRWTRKAPGAEDPPATDLADLAKRAAVASEMAGRALHQEQNLARERERERELAAQVAALELLCAEAKGGAAGKTADAASGAAGKTADAASGAAGKTADAAGKTADAASEAAGKTANEASEAAGKTASEASGAGGAGAASEASGAVGAAASEAAGKTAGAPPATDDLAGQLRAASQRLRQLRDWLADAELQLGKLRYVAHHTAHALGAYAGQGIHQAAEQLPNAPASKELLRDAPPPLRTTQQEMPTAKALALVRGFLLEYLQYDCNKHVMPGKDKKANYGAEIEHPSLDPADPTVITYGALRDAPLESAAEWPPEDKAALAALRALPDSLRVSVCGALLGPPGGEGARQLDALERAAQGPLQRARRDPRRFALQLARLPADSPARHALTSIPPGDTFHRLDFYLAVNYDALRAVTEAVYAEVPHLEYAIYPLTVLTGTKEERDKAFADYTQKFGDDFTSSVYHVDFGAWNNLASTAANRERVSFYNNQTAVLKRIIDRHADDQKLGAKLMENRVLREKAKNVSQAGPDHPGLSKYRAAQGGAALPPTLTAEQQAALAKADGDLPRYHEYMNLHRLQVEREQLLALQQRGPLQAAEALRLRDLQREIPEAQEQLEVPADKIQIDGFVVNAAEGSADKVAYYIPAEKPAPGAAQVSRPGERPAPGPGAGAQ